MLDLVSYCDIIFYMNSGARKTLEAIFANPTRKNIPWAEIESLFLTLGATVSEGSGSRVKFIIGNHSASFHRPHNPSTARIYQVKQACKFLTDIGIKP